MPRRLQSGEIAPGALVRSAQNPEWGTGQVQSALGDKVTVNFEEAGKQVLDITCSPLEENAPKRSRRKADPEGLL